jgi:hypothetical protein
LDDSLGKKLVRSHFNKNKPGMGCMPGIPAMQKAQVGGLRSEADLGKKHETLSEK